ncbi:unnamed protein product [Microthlaspi erraticum]|uniref:Uncharacterized protein n=1 Tax=Microthlaspi erraticum TaxID=1685480 RepID=A0A6D2IDF5_9BRAS|nr:unnamed protein product [Microthlaspi erraticum]
MVADTLLSDITDSVFDLIVLPIHTRSWFRLGRSSGKYNIELVVTRSGFSSNFKLIYLRKDPKLGIGAPVFMATFLEHLAAKFSRKRDKKREIGSLVPAAA